uniref:ascorbate ferrireductase (transmembrane) n=1 Tax=Ditylenchus dipsaci TaxID=166011 RepID=A0A915DKI2_9BILA
MMFSPDDHITFSSSVSYLLKPYHAPDILMLDKPINNLNIESIQAVAEAIEDFEGGSGNAIYEIDGVFDAFREEIVDKLNETLAPPPRNIRFYIFRFLLYEYDRILETVYSLHFGSHLPAQFSSLGHFAFAADTEEEENENGRVFLADFEARDRLEMASAHSPQVPQPKPMKNYHIRLWAKQGLYKSDGQRIFMELLGQINADKNAFVAVAFSYDTIMGNDTVTSCSSFQDEPFSGRLSFNPGKTNRKVPVEDNFLSSGLTENRQLTVHSLDQNSDRFPFISKSFVLLTTFEQQNASFAAMGETEEVKENQTTRVTQTESSETTEKDGPPPSTTEKPKVSSEESARLMRLLKAHAILMILAWTVLVPTAILSARYLRDHYINKVMGVHVWFLIHRSVNFLAVVMITASFVCIFARKDWMWMGPVLDGFAWFQPLSALLSGLIAWTLAMVTLYIGITTFRAFSNPLLAKQLFISYLAILLCSFLVLEFVRLQKSWRKKQQAELIAPEQQHKLPAYNNNFVQEGTRNALDVTVEPANQKKLNAVQKGVLLSFVACAIATAVFICLLILF